MGLFTKRRSGESGENQIEEDPEIADVHEKLRKATPPTEVEEVALKEIEKLKQTNESATEYTIGINYLNYLVELPWNKTTEDNLDIKRAQKILDEEHYGLTDIKERILEYLAVRILRSSRRYKILVVDDDRIARRNLTRFLSGNGYSVITSENGKQALASVKRDHPDLIVTDLKMREIDGMELLSRVKELDANLKVIMVSGFATTPVAVEAMKKGLYHFLAKPLKLDELLTTVQKALENKTKQLDPKGAILCLVGPPGTGKTSLQHSIARSLGRKFISISLAGMKDEAEIRGHRRSYVGALPGRIIQEIKRVNSKNPLIILDEIDKIGQDFKGDPASALLEVLDHSQNNKFMDHYLDVPFDLSRAMFIATANTIDPIPPPLLDRMELLYLTGYTEEEKLEIAFRFLIPRELEEAGLTDQPPTFSKKVIKTIIRSHTREAGLRSLQRKIAAICRKTARKILHNGKKAEQLVITPEVVKEYLGTGNYFFETAEGQERIGTATGLALTETGGQIILIEAAIMKGREELILTGSLGDVMKESARAALTYVRSNAEQFGIVDDFFQDRDIHIHIPAGAVPKDGPSAGLPITVALISLCLKRKIRRDVALTGELTLTGRILPVGGIRGKLLAARRAGIKTVIIPGRNRAELEDIPKEVSDSLNIVTTDEVAKIIEITLR